MYINNLDLQNIYNNQLIPYVVSVSGNVNNSGIFGDLNDVFENLSISVKPLKDRERIFSIASDFVRFGNEENKILDEYISSISVERKNNLLDYYD